MAFNLLDAVKSYFTTDLVQKAASFNGETESAVSNALKVAVPVSLAGILHKAESSPESILTIAREEFIVVFLITFQTLLVMLVAVFPLVHQD